MKTASFLITESEILDRAALAAYVPQVQAALKTAGGSPAVISSVGGRIVGLVGEPPATYVVSEWQSVGKAEAWLNSREYTALAPQRDKAYRVIRQFIVAAQQT